MNGYILLHKKIINSDIWNKPPLYLKVFLYILMKAQYQDHGTLKRGQTVITISELQDACSYYSGYRKVKPTRDQIFSVIEYLRTPNTEPTPEPTMEPTMEPMTDTTTGATMITTAKTTRGMVVTVCNYNVYQDSKKYGANSGTNNGDNNGTNSGHPHGALYGGGYGPLHDKEIINKNKNKEGFALAGDCGKVIPLQEQCTEEPSDEATPEQREYFVNMMLERLKARDG